MASKHLRIPNTNFSFLKDTFQEKEDLQISPSNWENKSAKMEQLLSDPFEGEQNENVRPMISHR